MKRGFGQNFLTDSNVAKKIVRLAEVKQGETVWEIGGGRGILTSALLERGCNLCVFEIDYKLQDFLQQSFGDRITLYRGDVLKYDWATLAGDKKCKIVANLPYNITTPTLFKIARFSKNISKSYLMMQKEVATRICSRPNCKSYGVLSVKMQFYFDVKKLFVVKPHLFNPRPKVDSCVVSFSPRIDKPVVKDKKLLFKIVNLAFGKRRKMLRSNLLSLLTNSQLLILEKSLQFSLTRRGETLNEGEFLSLYTQISKIKDR